MTSFSEYSFEPYDPNIPELAQFFVNKFSSDSTSRKAPLLCNTQDYINAVNILNRATDISIVTGFFVPGAGRAETDGPPGSAVLGRALTCLGKDCRLITDTACQDVVSTCTKTIGGPSVFVTDDPNDIFTEFPNMNAIVFIERLGHASDKNYYNMRGEDISAFTPPLDLAAEIARSKNIPIIGIGDGGNEVGMGSIQKSLSSLVPNFSGCICTLSADACIPVDVSNWGSYALVGLLSLKTGIWLGHSPDEESEMLHAMKTIGAVDGTTKNNQLSVDGFSAYVNCNIVGLIDTYCHSFMRQV